MQNKGLNSNSKGGRALFVIALLIIAHLSSVIAQEQQQVLNKRMAGYHYSVVFTGESMPSSAVLTYPIKTPDYQNYNFLVKFMPCLSVGGKIIYPSAFTNVKVEDFPGGVEALSLIHISEPTRLGMISYAVF